MINSYAWLSCVVIDVYASVHFQILTVQDFHCPLLHSSRKGLTCSKGFICKLGFDNLTLIGTLENL